MVFLMVLGLLIGIPAAISLVWRLDDGTVHPIETAGRIVGYDITGMQSEGFFPQVRVLLDEGEEINVWAAIDGEWQNLDDARRAYEEAFPVGGRVSPWHWPFEQRDWQITPIPPPKTRWERAFWPAFWTVVALGMVAPGVISRL